MNSNPQVLKIIAQGVINSLFAKETVRIAPVVREVIDEGRDRFEGFLSVRMLSARGRGNE